TSGGMRKVSARLSPLALAEPGARGAGWGGCNCPVRGFSRISAGWVWQISRPDEGVPVTADRYLFTSESVSMGHPDKVADQISDAVLDHCLRADPTSRVACETLVTTDLAVVAGEITSEADLSPAVVDRIVRDTVREIGYLDPAI